MAKKMTIGVKDLRKEGRVLEINIPKEFFQGHKNCALEFETFYNANKSNMDIFVVYWKRFGKNKKHFLARTIK